ncbi:MAG: zinc ribbon domain-containing protein [Deltaproteobacteria bacterium]|nr:zinc ribbon domain-containing protein [Deltaproteobacteria bacterium]
MPCQGCGRDNPDDARFCSGCGAPQQRSVRRQQKSDSGWS